MKPVSSINQKYKSKFHYVLTIDNEIQLSEIQSNAYQKEFPKPQLEVDFLF